jgi:hypothetical protein
MMFFKFCLLLQNMDFHLAHTSVSFTNALQSSNYPLEIKMQYLLLHQALKDNSFKNVEQQIKHYSLGLKYGESSFIEVALCSKNYNLLTECIKRGIHIRPIVWSNFKRLFEFFEYLVLTDQREVIDRCLDMLRSELKQLFPDDRESNKLIHKYWNENNICKTLPLAIYDNKITLNC